MSHVRHIKIQSYCHNVTTPLDGGIWFKRIAKSDNHNIRSKLIAPNSCLLELNPKHRNLKTEGNYKNNIIQTQRYVHFKVAQEADF